ncbi:MAG: hypothetical protein ACRC4M_04315 [Mycoplasma sp.]
MNDVNIYLVSDNLVKYLEDKSYNSALDLWNSDVKDILIKNKNIFQENKSFWLNWAMGFTVGVAGGSLAFLNGLMFLIINMTNKNKKKKSHKVENTEEIVQETIQE